MLRRIVAIGLFLGLLALEPGGLSLCALLSAMAGECATPATKTVCNEMSATQPEVRISAETRAQCCQLSAAPFPEAQDKVSTPSLEVWQGHVVLFSRLASFRANHEIRESATVSPPPDLLPLLCTFLI